MSTSTSTSATEFLAFVEREANLAPPHAERAVQATLETLGERISSGEADDLAAELPEPLRDWVRSEGNAEASTGVRARPFATLRETVSEKELSDTVAQLPDDYRALLARAE
jgi:uncharacterized protein (DUF2267 family)